MTEFFVAYLPIAAKVAHFSFSIIQRVNPYLGALLAAAFFLGYPFS
jgi:hypothetical protein